MRLNWGCSVVNAIWAAASVKEWRRFRAALCDPAEAQQRMLRRYVRLNADTAFGREHGFRSVQSIRDYQDRVPIRTYDDLEPLTRRVSHGEPRVLTRSSVERMVPSSGSTAGAKLVPFTAELRREFSRAVDTWLVDLLMQEPAIAGGPAYWSISPAAGFDAGARTAGAAAPTIPVGFDEDSRYLGATRQLLARAIMAVPADVGRVHDIDAFRYATALFLLRARNLRLISVWHPSFFERLLDTIAVHYDRLLHDIARGSFTVPRRLQTDVGARLLPRLDPNPRRAEALREVSPRNVGAIWPRLAAISCWADGPARGPASQLAARCPGIRLQPKGLLATEGVVTIPLDGLHPIAVTSHFFEFVEPGGRVRLAHDLQAGAEYSVVLTTAGGLYRYQLGDRVRVDGFVGSTPSVRYIGKDDRVSDWFGEKLSEGFVASVLESLFAGGPLPRFAMLAPEHTSTGLAYTLLLEADGGNDHRLAARLERMLRANPHYAWCVGLQQLSAARVVRVRPGATQAYIDGCVARGQRLGDVKPASLRSETGWMNALQRVESGEPEVQRSSSPHLTCGPRTSSGLSSR